MLHVHCPSCDERGKVPIGLVGARVKCKKCGAAFQVCAPGKTDAPLATVLAGARAADLAHSHHGFEGIAVEGLDDTAWSVAPEESSLVHPVVTAPSEAATASEPVATPQVCPAREYKLLTSRDKVFEGRFDLARLEDALNHYARQGWTAKSMCLPHVKNFQGALQEEVVVLLERG